MRVLVVDDDPKLLYILKRILEIDRHEVTISSGGLEAVRLFTSQPDNFDLILTDIQMKDLNGWEIARTVRLLRPDLPLIVITGGAAELQPEKLRQYAITEVVSKPYSLDDMQSLIRKLAKPAH
jgi:CheY-like chemotaxis protein